MNNGFISLHRKILDNPIWKNSELSHLFIHLLMLATYDPHKFLWNGKEEMLERGQLITGRLSLAEQLNMNQRTLYDRLKLLQKLGIINIKSNNRFSLITIVKYSQYQSTESKTNSTSNNKPTTGQQQTNTYNKGNKENKGNKNTIAEASSADWTLKDYKEKLEESPKREMNIIALYWDYKKPILNNLEQARGEVKRSIRSATQLKAYEDKRLISTMEYLKKQANFKWTLETVLKYITERNLKNA